MNNKRKNPPEFPVIFAGRKFKAIELFDCRTVCLSNGFVGSFSATIPISSKKTKTIASISISVVGEWTIFNIQDDWGITHYMKIHNSLENNIASAKLAAQQRYLVI